jgi:hypothetical protein
LVHYSSQSGSWPTSLSPRFFSRTEPGMKWSHHGFFWSLVSRSVVVSPPLLPSL